MLTKGPQGAAFNFSYKCRDDDAPAIDLGNVLNNLTTIVPNGILVFFSSYALMTKCYNFWNSP